MPSYKNHLVFSLLIPILVTVPFFPNVFYLSLAVIGASIVDLDHPLRNSNLLLLALFGIILVLLLHILQMPVLIGPRFSNWLKDQLDF